MSRYHVIGRCSLHGLSDGAALLGPVPQPWKAQLEHDSNGFFKSLFHNTTTGENRREDPRLPTLPPEWEEIEAIRTIDDPIHFARFRNKQTSEVMNSDPRLILEALRERAVNVQTFQLI
jgi:hypothetical protein